LLFAEEGVGDDEDDDSFACMEHNITYPIRWCMTKRKQMIELLPKEGMSTVAVLQLVFPPQQVFLL